MAKTISQASVLPAGSAVVANLEAGAHWLEIVIKEEQGNLIRVKFPDGFTKAFQATEITALTPQLTNQLRGRYGVESVEYTEVPKALEVGALIKFKI